MKNNITFVKTTIITTTTKNNNNNNKYRLEKITIGSRVNSVAFCVI